MRLLVLLNMESKVKSIASRAIQVAGINQRLMHQQLGLLEEKNQRLNTAISYYRKAYAYSFERDDADDSNADIERVKNKISRDAKISIAIKIQWHWLWPNAIDLIFSPRLCQTLIKRKISGHDTSYTLIKRSFMSR